MSPASRDTGAVGTEAGLAAGSHAPRRVVAVAAEAIKGPEALEEIRRGANGGGLEVRVVVPAVEETQLRHAFGDVDDSTKEAGRRLEVSLSHLRLEGIAARGEVGDPDPVLAAEDALREEPADEIVIFDHVASQRRWFESGLFERAQEALEVPLRMVHVRDDADAGWAHVVAVEEVGADAVPDGAGAEEVQLPISDNLPRFSTLDLGGMAMGVVGTIVAIVLAAAGPGPESGAGAASILIAIAISLINMAHVVGLTLFESVHYRGGWETFFRTLALVGTPLAVLANLLILVLA